MAFVDSHCHLDFPDFSKEIDQILERALSVQVTRLLTIGTKISDADLVIGLAEKYPYVFASVGVHPEYAEAELSSVSCELLCSYANHPKVVGFGETGLDYHYGSSNKKEQQELFRRHLKAAKQTGLPVIVHSREAEEDTIRLLQEEYDSSLKGVLHCYTSKPELALAGLELGFYVSASGIITFNKAEELRETFKKIPLDRLLIETDAPFLAPVPYRGKRNEPSYVVKTAEKLAVLKGVSLDEIEKQTTENFLNLFSKAV